MIHYRRSVARFDPPGWVYVSACGRGQILSREPKEVTCGACRRTSLYKHHGETLTDLVRRGIVKSVRPPADVRGQ